MVRLSARWAAARGDAAAIIDDRGAIGWRAFDERANRCLTGLRGRGHGVGATVATMCGNRREVLETMLAMFHGGHLSSPVNVSSSVDELAYQLDDSGASALFVEDVHHETARAAVDRIGRAVDLIVIGAGRTPVAAGIRYEAMLADASPAEPDDQVLGALMMYTSGTTGRPKGVRSRPDQLGDDIRNADLIVQGYAELFGIDVEGRMLVAAPLHHGGPHLFGAVMFAAGCPLVLRRRFDAARALREIDELGITHAYFVPTHFARFLRLPPDVRAAFDGSSLRSVWHTAAPCAPDLKRAMIDWWGPVLHETYSASDAGIGTMISSREWLQKPGSVGRASPLSEILIVGDDGELLPAGETGTICFRSRYGTDITYHNDPVKTAAAHLAPGVVTVGDVGYLDDDGYLFLRDRAVDLIISGGVNVYPAEVEARLLAHPAVVDAAVFGIPDDDLGEQVCASVLVARHVERDDRLAAELRAHCRETLAGHKVPKVIEFPDEFPRTETGKLLKRRLRDPHWAGAGRLI